MTIYLGRLCHLIIFALLGETKLGLKNLRLVSSLNSQLAQDGSAQLVIFLNEPRYIFSLAIITSWLEQLNEPRKYNRPEAND